MAPKITWNTISNYTIWKALHTPGGDVRDYIERRAKECGIEAVRTSPVNSPLNAKHRGGVVGTYKASWKIVPKGNNQYRSSRIVLNVSDHAMIVERGKPYVRKRQVFSWKHARKSKMMPSGRWGYKPDPGGMVSTKVVHKWGRPPSTAPRAGYHVLENASKKVARVNGMKRSLKLTV